MWCDKRGRGGTRCDALVGTGGVARFAPLAHLVPLRTNFTTYGQIVIDIRSAFWKAGQGTPRRVHRCRHHRKWLSPNSTAVNSSSPSKIRAVTDNWLNKFQVTAHTFNRALVALGQHRDRDPHAESFTDNRFNRRCPGRIEAVVR
jgi:hypothetical protein